MSVDHLMTHREKLDTFHHDNLNSHQILKKYMKILKFLCLTILLFAVGFMTFPITDTFADHSKGWIKVTTDKEKYNDHEKIFIIGSGGIEFKSYIAVITTPDYVSVASEPVIANDNGNFYAFIEIDNIIDSYYGHESPPINGIYTISVRGNSFDDNHVYDNLTTVIIGENKVFDPRFDIAEIHTDKEYYNTKDILKLSGTLDKYPSPYALFTIIDKDGHEILIDSIRINSDNTFSKEIELYGLKLNMFGIPTFMDHGEYTIKLREHEYYDQNREIIFNVGVVKLEIVDTEESDLSYLSELESLYQKNKELEIENKSLQETIIQMQNTLKTIFKLIEELN